MRSLASGKVVAQFSVATNAYIGQGKERPSTKPPAPERLWEYWQQ
jgi:hypothetical protein